MKSLRELYNAQILELSKDRSNLGVAEPTTHCAQACNALCGDQITVTLCKNPRIEQVRYSVEGCALVKASAALMSSLVGQGHEKDIHDLREKLLDALRTDGPTEVDQRFALFLPLRGVRGRHKCVTLPWEALEAALANTR